jgi:hypothetical protein
VEVANETGARRRCRGPTPAPLGPAGGGAPYPTVLGPAAPAAWPTRGRIVDARPPQWPGRVSRRLPRRGRRTASLPQASPLRACSQIVGSCHSRASKDGRQRYAAVVHGQRKSPLSCGFVHKPWTTPYLIWLWEQGVAGSNPAVPTTSTNPLLNRGADGPSLG